jgi:hypothetical protein
MSGSRDCPTQDCPWPDEAHLNRCPHHPARLTVLADLRDKVTALRDKRRKSLDRDPDGRLSAYDRAHIGALDDVLALIDEEQR